MPQISNPAPPGFIDPRFDSLPPPPPGQDFSGRLDGVVIPVWKGDLYLAKACCASVRQSMGDIPITLFVDGPATDTRELQRLHGCSADGDAGSCRRGRSPPLHRHAVDQNVAVLDKSLRTLSLSRRGPPGLGRLAGVCRVRQIRFHTDQSFPSHGHISEAGRSCWAAYPTWKYSSNWIPLWTGAARRKTIPEFSLPGAAYFQRQSLMTLRRMNCWTCYESGVFRYLHWRALREGVPADGRMQIAALSGGRNFTPGRPLFAAGLPAAGGHPLDHQKTKIGPPFSRSE